ncbi:hypothetical protein [Aurantiacibacter sp. MUD61]|uniref:hypothetical protein n=1 Tax=Aurantiacibacter sp. MUD61 TaxID=3009083 RepID=UPI0022F0FCCC|nr:hypothetical protein [Aurantiacibacter sp. MUD61]
MRFLLLLPLVSLIACAAGDASSDPGAPTPGFATQREAPTPDYAEIIANAPMLEPHVGSREPSEAAPDNAAEIGQLWRGRLESLGVLDGYGLSGNSDNSPISSFSLRMTASDFDDWLMENAWEAPRHIRFDFVPPMGWPRITPEAEEQVRIWPASEARTGLQLEAASGGQIYLEDGCFFVLRTGREEPELAWFHTETGLDVDSDGYFVLVNRTSGQVEGRLGEEFTWASPNPITPGGPPVEELRAACGVAEIYGVGNPTANAKLGEMYPRSAPDAIPPPDIH